MCRVNHCPGPRWLWIRWVSGGGGVLRDGLFFMCSDDLLVRTRLKGLLGKGAGHGYWFTWTGSSSSVMLMCSVKAAEVRAANA